MKSKVSIPTFMDALNNGLGEGPLTIGIFCTKCNAQYALGYEGAATAIALNVTFLDYLRWVQSSPCHACEKKESEGGMD